MIEQKIISFLEQYGEKSLVDQLDHQKINLYITDIQRSQQFFSSLYSSFLTAIIALFLWGNLIYLTEFDLSWLSIPIGIVIGFVTRFSGKGFEYQFGVMAGCVTFVTSIFASVLYILIIPCKENNISLLDILAVVDFPIIVETFLHITHWFDYLLYLLAIFLAFYLSYQNLSKAVINKILLEHPIGCKND